jgi:hypothetical protein
MGVRFPSVASNTFVGPLPASAAETVVLTTPPINEPVDNAQVLFVWQATIITGTSQTAVRFGLRRGTTTAGPLLGTGQWIYAIAAALQGTYGGCYFDLPGIVAGQQYSLTYIQQGATVAGTWNDGCLIAMVL